ncbi:Hypothetical Protein FCC1311_003392 [Hondaea fermentalgiana]|uniref:Uncharacterized protein n=1 Tax=Hondaea fermentalgiana TaxID=2315210 RepID=A0A2R5G7W2_9STRA|nr:Hypothetical Protein FCC1311_003392 [Hondaea fermentalgiana]|eukprot:GBG24121.1 Hypothetical Protein FCC1311_003392 [Hondaea fermentalgiana]
MHAMAAGPVLLATLLVAGQVGAGDAQASTCNLGVNTIYAVQQRCSTESGYSGSVSYNTCCGLWDSDFVFFEDDRGVCTYYQNAYGYCTSVEDCDVDEDDVLTISLTFSTTSESDTCCRTCKCVGDPDCVSFNNTPASWVLCDGRRKGDCKQGRSPCRRQRDHMGNRCQWLKNDPDYLGWEASGSPCQVNWEKSGHPTMLMYESGLFSVTLTLGERGVIDSLSVTTGDTGDSFELDADACFEHDPRLTPDDTSAASEAWTSASGSAIPDAWTVSTPNSVEIMWKVVDDTTGTNMHIYCTQPPDSERTRLDVKHLFTLTDESEAEDEDGFCVTSTIDRGLATTKYEDATDDYDFQQKCLVQTLPDLLATCKIIMGADCTPYNLDTYVTEWCLAADITYTDLAGDRDECISMLVTTGSESDRGERWTRYLCQLNLVDDVNECMALVSQFGWAQFLVSNSNGLDQSEDSLTASCASSVAAYSKREGDSAVCAYGVFIDYLVSGTVDEDDAVWEQAFFIPYSLPPCNGQLLIDGTQYPELFSYPIRMSRCSQSIDCVADLECAPIPGFSVSFGFSTENCTVDPDGEIYSSDVYVEEDCFASECEANEDVISNPQTVCEAVPDSPLELGTCESCCVAETLLGVDGSDSSDTPRCREVYTQEAYCNTLDESLTETCARLISEEGEGVLTVELSMDSSELDCCRTCAAWGDPLISSFSGETSKWINCDGRNSNCKVKKNVCKKQRDQAGNKCVYNATIAELIEIGSDIGAYGSPCQSDVSLSGEAILTMYETEGFRINITNGERSVITHATIETLTDVFTFDSSLCFNEDPYEAWTSASGDDVADGPLALMFADTDREHEKKWTVRDSESGIFMKIVCLRRVSQAGFVGGYRMNIESLIDTVTNRTTSSGFCETGTIDYGLATINKNGDVCQQNIEGIVQFCSAVASPSCQQSQVTENIRNWCDTANVFVQDVNHAQKCVKAIGPSRSNDNKVLADWQAVYCDAVNSLRDPSQTEDTWRALCVSRLQNEGFASVVADLGDGRLTSSSQSAYCAANATVYTPKSDIDGCMPGVSVEYRNVTESDAWTEVFFIPQSLPPCGDRLEILATDFPELFLNQIRFRQCELNTTACPVETHTDSYCAAAQGYTVSYMYSQSTSVCDNDA